MYSSVSVSTRWINRLILKEYDWIACLFLKRCYPVAGKLQQFRHFVHLEKYCFFIRISIRSVNAVSQRGSPSI